MRPGGGKAKGSAFEREVCKRLSLWMSKDKRDDLFWRSAMSGGRASVQFKKGVQNLSQTGDITAIDPAGAPLTDIFLIECKFYSDLDLDGLIIGTQGGITGFWKELVEKCKEQGKKHPMLIAKQNRLNPIICLTPDGADLLQTSCSYNAYLPVLRMRFMWFEKFLAMTTPPGQAQRRQLLVRR